MMQSLRNLSGVVGLIVLAALGLSLFPLDALAQVYVDAPGFDSGSSAWTVYAFGNAQAVSDSLRAINNFVTSGTFRGIVTLLAVIGVLSVGVSSGFSAMMARSFVSYAVFVLFIVFLLFGLGGGGPLNVRVEVIDTVDNTWKAPVNVPAVIGIPASLISNAGYSLTKQVEASFPIPDELKISNGAPFNLAASLMNDVSKARIQDPHLANSLNYYIQDCFMIAAARGEINASTLMNSTDFINDIRTDYPSIFVNSTLTDPVGVPKVMTCADSYNAIVAAINAQGEDSSAFLTDATAWHSTPALSVVNSAVDRVASWATNGAASSGGSMVKQAAMIAAFKPSFNHAVATTGNSDFLNGLALAQASETQRNSWVVGAQVFNKVMGYIFAILQVFIYALTPLILAAALIPTLGMSLLKNFGQVLIWLAIWQPMLGIVNFIILSMQQANLGGALATAGSMGISMNNLAIVSERSSTMSAAATFIGTMVPILAWAFVKGSVDFSRIIGSAVGENFAQQAGSTMTTGNFSLNQASLDSFTANKTSISSTSDFGNGYSANGVDRYSSRLDMGGAQVSSSGAGISVAGQTGNVLSNAQALANSAGTNQASGTAASFATTQGYQRGSGTTEQGSSQKMFNEMDSAGARLGADVGASGSANRPGSGKSDKLPPTSVGNMALNSAINGGEGPANASSTFAAKPQSMLGKVGDAVSAVTPTLTAGVRGGIDLGKQFAQGDTDVHSKTGQQTENETSGWTAQNSRNYSNQSVSGRVASDTQSAARNSSQTVSSPSDAYSRGMAQGAAMSRELFNGGLMQGMGVGADQNDSLQQSWYGDKADSITQDFNEAYRPGGFTAKLEERKESIQDDLEANKKKAGANSGVGALGAGQAQQLQGVKTAAETRLSNAAEESNRSPITQAKEAAGNAIAQGVEKVKELKESIEAKLPWSEGEAGKSGGEAGK